MQNYQLLTQLKSKFSETEGYVQIPLLKGDGHFNAKMVEGGIEVDNLHQQPLLPWAVFDETINLLKAQSGRAPRGDAMNHKLGDEQLPLGSVEGHIAHKVYNKQIGDSVFRRITPIACILIWAGICGHASGELILRD